MVRLGYKAQKRGKSATGEEEDFNLRPDALSALTKNIEANLKNAKSKVPPQNRLKNGVLISGNAKYLSNGKISQKYSSSKVPLQGKKRVQGGQLKEPGHPVRKPGNHTPNKRTEVRLLSERSQLEEEILALGGTENDLKLVADLASDSEIEGDLLESKSSAPDGLRKDLSGLIQELGIKRLAPNDSDIETSREEQSDLDGTVDTIKSVYNNGSSKDIEAKHSIQVARPGKRGLVQLELEPQPEWYKLELPSIPLSGTKLVALPPDLINVIKKYARSLLDYENERYASQTGSANSAHQFYSTIMSSGTLSDKISALTLSVQESPLHNMKALENLVGLARKRSRGQAVEVLGALKDLFGLGALLPSDRKLKLFGAQPSLSVSFMSSLSWTSDKPLPKSITKAHLIFWAYEDWLKSTYLEIIKILESWCSDEVVFARGKAVEYVCQLLREKPEQEANLLRLLVNKLGDNDKKIASKTSYNILQLENTHPLMKPTIISCIESDLIFRPGQSLHAQYYATITLNQTVLSGKEESVAKKLVDIYFALFAQLLAKPKPNDPMTKDANAIKVNKKGEIQGGGGPAGKAARQKAALQQKSTTVEDDLREKMLSAVLTGVNRAIPFTNTDTETFDKHLDTLYRITHSSNFNTSIQALMLIQQLNDAHQSSKDRFYRTLYESLLDPRLMSSSKQAMYLNLLFRALRSDLNVRRVKAFSKRLLQVVAMHQPSFTCGALYLLRELEGIFANLSNFIDESEEGDDDEEEHFRDVLEDGGFTGPRVQNEANKAPQSVHYDGKKRDPEHSNADRSSLWEILLFLPHYHPSVSLFATHLLAHNPMPPKPDLQSHTLIHFLDRFVYRNPKSKPTAPRGASIMQPLSGGDSSGLLLLPSAEKQRLPVNNEAFWKREGVGADEVFFQKYFSSVNKGKGRGKKEKERKRKDREESAGEEEEEEEIWKALVDSRPEVEGPDDGTDLEDGSGDFDEKEMENAMRSSDDDDDDGVEVLDDENEEGNVEEEEESDFDFGDSDDADALMGSDDEVDVPGDLEGLFAKENIAIVIDGSAKRERAEKGDGREKKRRKLKSLPTFAEADEYAAVMGDEED